MHEYCNTHGSIYRLDGSPRDLIVLCHCNKKASADDYSKRTDDDDNGDRQTLRVPARSICFSSFLGG